MAIAPPLPSPSPTKKTPLSSKWKQRKALEAKKRLLQKKPTSTKQKTKKVIFDIPTNSQASCEPKMATSVDPPDSRAKSSAMERATDVQARLSFDFPSFVKPMLPSHVTGGFWLSFPKRFCDLHLPKHDDTVVLVDEDEQEYETKYLIDKNGLSGGWRGFSIAHKLLEGDALVFQLIKPCKFKVYITRVNGFTELDGAVGLLSLAPCGKPVNVCKLICILFLVLIIDTAIDIGCYLFLLFPSFELKTQGHTEKGTENDQKLEEREIDLHQENAQEKGMAVFDQSGGEIGDLGLEVFEGLRFSQSVIDFKDVKTIEDFNIVVDDLVIDSEIPKHFRIKYYDLCRSQKSYIHENLLKGLNVQLAVGVILETVTIADAIRACKITTTRDDLETWDKTLKAFEEVGMKVGFLRARISTLVRLLFESEVVLEAKRTEQAKAEEEMRVIEKSLSRVREVIKNLGDEIYSLKLKGENLDPVFHREANAPW